MTKPDNDNTPCTSVQGGLRFLSVCSGIEAASVAWPHWQAVAFSEIEKFPSAVLAHHYPDVPNLGDFTRIDTTRLGRVDILCGGTPCQAFSVAGLRQSLADERGNLSLEFVRLAHELAGNGATNGNGLRNVVWENVVGVLSTKDNAFGCFLAGLVGADAPLVPPCASNGKPGKWTRHGMVAGPKGRCAWAVKDAQFFGVAQRRRRVLVVADFGNGADPATVLFEPEGVLRHPPARGEAGQDIAPTISARTKGGCGLGTDFDLDGGLVQHAPEIARCVATREGSSQDYESTTMVAVGVTGTTSHSPTAAGADASEDGTGRGTPVIAFNARQDPTHGPIADALGTKDNGRGIMYQAQTVAIRGRDGGATAELGGDVATALRASTGGGDKPHVLYAPETYSTLSASEGGTMTQIMPIVTSAVRRLTPMECERLQGFPDGYTAIPWRGKPAEECPDGPRYKALGNSWAVPKFAWLGERIERLMPSVAPPHAANDNASRQPAQAKSA